MWFYGTDHAEDSKVLVSFSLGNVNLTSTWKFIKITKHLWKELETIYVKQLYENLRKKSSAKIMSLELRIETFVESTVERRLEVKNVKKNPSL